MGHAKTKIKQLPVLVTGSGNLTRICSQALTDNGYRVILFTHNKLDTSSLSAKNVQIFDESTLKRFDGYPTSFEVEFIRNNAPQKIKVGAVVLANEPEKEDAISLWGFPSNNRVKTVSWVESALNRRETRAIELNQNSWIAILSGIKAPSYPFSQKRSILNAMSLKKDFDCRVLFLTDNLRVADKGIDRLMEDARNQGILFVKTGDNGFPEISQQNGRIKISYLDDAINQKVSFEPQLLLIEDVVRPSEEVKSISEIMGIRVDGMGFFQCENIRNRPIGTNREGVWVIGSAKGDLSDSIIDDDINAVLLEINSLYEKAQNLLLEQSVLLDSKRCTICLTCYRLCPHRAISIVNRRPVFHAISCRRCGICISECPMEALSYADEMDEKIKNELKVAIDEIKRKGDKSSPLLVAFCCENSAYEAYRFSKFLGHEFPDGLCVIKVPCAGRIGQSLILRAIEYGAHGVMALGCHDGSCRSLYGSLISEWRMKTLDEFWEFAGIKKHRVFFGTLSPSMGVEFFKLADMMSNKLKED